MSGLILYTTQDGKSRIQLRADLDTVWLTQLEMAELFNATKQNISLHLKNIVEDGELEADSVVKESLTTAADGKNYPTQLYNLDAILAVGYLTEDEIDTLNRLVVIFLETAELRTKNRQEIRMGFWRQSVDQIISSNGFPVLTHAGTVSHAQMETRTNTLYLDFDQRRKQQEAQQADRQDEAELKAVETKIKHRSKK